VPQRGSCRSGSAHAMCPGARRGGSRAQEYPGEAGGVRVERGTGAQDELRDGLGAGEDVAADEVGVPAAKSAGRVVRRPTMRSRLRGGRWAHVRRSLANLAVVALDRLEALVHNRLKRLQYRPDTLDGFMAGTGLTPDDPASP
jgi:hypothetical protein